MNRIGEELSAAPKRTLPIKARADLRIKRQRFHQHTFWVVKDPVSLRYFKLTDEEYAVLQTLNGEVSLADLQRKLEDRFAPRRVSFEELQSLLHLFHQRGLVIAGANDQGARLWERRREARRKRWLGFAANPLAIRLPAIDPERFLAWLYPRFRWVYHSWCQVLCGLLILSAFLLVTTQYDVVKQRLPTFHEFFVAGNLIWLMVALALSKALHELAHGLTCKHFGGECHEMGVILLVFTPCLYCDTTDSWMLSNKWHRAAVGAAGMYVEVVLASICTWLWWWSQPGLLHYLCLSTMFVCSISTVVFNGNPLIRYDGYYILADVVEIPNLWQRSRAALAGLLGHWCLGLPWSGELVVPEKRRRLFALYAVASTCYRWFVLVMILWFLTHVLEPLGLQVIGRTLALLVIVSLLAVPTWALVRFLRVPGRLRQVKIHRLLATAVVLICVLLLVVSVPIPHYVTAPLTTQPRGAQRVYVEVPGLLDSVDAQPGDSIKAGQSVARLSNIDISLRLARVSGERERLVRHLQNLVRRQGHNQLIAEQIPVTQAALVDIDQQLVEYEKDQQRLRLTAPRSGIVLPPPEIPAPGEADETLPNWTGSPLDTTNVGCYLETGTLFCLIGDADEIEVVMVIDQSDVQYVAEGQQVEMLLDGYPSNRIRGEVETVARQDLQVVPQQLSHKTGGTLNTVTDASGRERSLNTSYQVRVRLQPDEHSLLPGMRGRGKIRVGSYSVAQRVRLFLLETFHFGTSGQ